MKAIQYVVLLSVLANCRERSPEPSNSTSAAAPTTTTDTRDEVRATVAATPQNEGVPVWREGLVLKPCTEGIHLAKPCPHDGIRRLHSKIHEYRCLCVKP